MEALTAVSVACLTLYDMLKAAEKGMEIGGCASPSRTAASPAATRHDLRRGGAGARIFALCDEMGTEEVPLAEAAGRVLAAGRRAARPAPVRPRR
jgi:hypothetical protein